MPGSRSWLPPFGTAWGDQCRELLNHPDTGGHTHPADGNLLPGPPLRQAGPDAAPIGAVYGELSEGVGGLRKIKISIFCFRICCVNGM